MPPIVGIMMTRPTPREDPTVIVRRVERPPPAPKTFTPPRRRRWPWLVVAVIVLAALGTAQHSIAHAHHLETEARALLHELR